MALSVEETEELIDDLNEYANSSVKVLEQAVVLVSRTKDGENVIQFPLTRLRQIEDIKDLPLEDGGLEWDDDMKLYVEASDLLQDGGGLTTDDNGDIYVDFSLMPTDKFESLLKTLTVPIYLDEDLYQYVDCNNGDDTIEDGRGSEDMPWKTISACVDYCTTYYNVNSHHIEIRVLAGTYDEGKIELGDFSRTTGYIGIVSYSGEHQAIITTTNKTTLNVQGGTWYLTGLKIICSFDEDGATDSSAVYGALYVEGGATVQIAGCEWYSAYEGGDDVAGVQIRMLYADNGGQIVLRSSSYTSSFEYHKGTASTVSLRVFYFRTGSKFTFYNSSSDGAGGVNPVEYVTHYCFGECTAFLMVSNQSVATWTGRGYSPQFIPPDGETATGQRFVIEYGSGVNTNEGGDDYFPGDKDGTVDEDTYCWYQ